MDGTGASGAAGFPHAGGAPAGSRAGHPAPAGGANGSGFGAMGGTAGYGGVGQGGARHGGAHFGGDLGGDGGVRQSGGGVTGGMGGSWSEGPGGGGGFGRAAGPSGDLPVPGEGGVFGGPLGAGFGTGAGVTHLRRASGDDLPPIASGAPRPVPLTPAATISSITAAGPGSPAAGAASPAPAAGGSGYRGPTACSVAGITYRQLDYWARTGLVEPSIRPASGSGSQRLYSFRDIIALKIVKRLLDTGVSLQNIRIAVGYLRARGDADLAGVTLMSDGASVYECTSPTEVFDLVQGGQGVFGIAVDAVCREVEGTLRQFPVERVGWAADGADPDPGDAPEAAGAVIDELARRRRIRAV